MGVVGFLFALFIFVVQRQNWKEVPEVLDSGSVLICLTFMELSLMCSAVPGL